MSPNILYHRSDNAADRQTNSLAGLALTLALVVVSLYLVDKLHAACNYQDCVLSGATGCTTAP